MPEIDPVILQLRADVDLYLSELKSATVKVDTLLNQQGHAITRLETQFSKSSSAMGESLKGLAVALAGAFTVRELTQLLDSAKQIDAQLRLATQASGSFAQAQDDVRRIAATTGSGLAETSKLYGNFVRNVQEMGGTQTDASRATETFTKALQLGGASAEEAASATLQFGQALASGTLRGDELNSILEASPRLARLIAESLGVTVGQLRNMGAQGEITSDKLFRALTDKKFTAGIDQEFSQLPITFDKAMTQIENAAIVVFGAFDRGGQFSTAIATFIADGSEGLQTLEGAAESFGRTLSGEFAGIIAVAKSLSSKVVGRYQPVALDALADR